MPAKRRLQMGHVAPPPTKIPVSVKSKQHLTHTGTKSSRAVKANTTTPKKDAPLTELEKLDSLRSKLEQSLDAFIRARKELEEIFPTEGSNEQEHLLSASTHLKAELKRHRELASRIETSVKGNSKQKNPSQENLNTADQTHTDSVGTADLEVM
ncbi:uncharacterized protein itgb3bp isoform X3 [Phyllopteryx taeniolatus]|uniref:uncharacterized protein itgb3bp isoform X3 n=1 Tax=Phyllopteryx taeniolatus TaxID=161469 RepID=UPI002AD33A92|nr:uncharacterized protein itgb3bp isoform X3 [Phyllopteryx taeniolatus]